MTKILEMRKDKLQVTAYSSREEMGAAAAHSAAQCFRELLEQKEMINVIFAAAPSQNETLATLVQEKGIDWKRVRAFHMDEYVGLPEGNPHTFGAYLREHIFGLVPFAQVHFLHGDAPKPEEECTRYSNLLKKNPADIVLLGIGENGHIAFNDPGVADFEDPVLVKKVPLDDVCRMQQVHDGCFPSLEEVPKYALTLTVPALMRAGHLFCSVATSTKAHAVAATVGDPISAKTPATAMRRHRCAAMFCDAEAAALLL